MKLPTRSPDLPAGVAAAYAECERITTAEARNFSYGIKLLPPLKRMALSAVYANSRRLDDIGDGDLPPEQKLAELEQAKAEMLKPADHPGDPRLVALADAASRMPIPLDALGELADGCTQDQVRQTYETFDDLVGYCRLVAGTVGRLSLGVFSLKPGADLDEASRLADELGVALQLTNILRDIREDLLMGRVYLPAADLALFGIDELRVLPGAGSEPGPLDPYGGRLAELIRFTAARAWGRYDVGLQLLPLLDRRSAACTAAMAGIYFELLGMIAHDPSRVFDRRRSLTAGEKVRVATRAISRPTALARQASE